MISIFGLSGECCHEQNHENMEHKSKWGEMDMSALCVYGAVDDAELLRVLYWIIYGKQIK